MKILIIRLSSLGDVVLVSTVIDALKENLPAADVPLVVNSRYADLYSQDPRLAEVIAAPSASLGFFQLLKKLRKMQFDAVLDLHFDIRSLLIRVLVPAEKMDRHGLRPGFRPAVGSPNRPVGSRR